MRLAVLSDIHGNPFALDAVLADIAAQGGVDGYWVLGDLVAFGPDPAAVIERLTALPTARFVRGNTDRYLTRNEDPPGMRERAAQEPPFLNILLEFARSIAWTRGYVTARGHLAWLEDLPLEQRMTLPDGTRLLGVHAAPGTDDGPGIHPGLSDAELAAVLAPAGADLVFVGHTHVPVDRTVGGVRVINLGSVSNPATADLRACYVLLDADETGYQARFRRVAYDRAAAMAAVERVGHPGRGTSCAICAAKTNPAGPIRRRAKPEEEHSVATDNAFPIFDGHNDTLLDLALPKPGQDRSFFTRSAYGHLDLPRAREGGFGGGFFAVFVPSFPRAEADDPELIITDDGYEVPMAPPVDLIPAQEMALALVASLFRLEVASDGQMQVVRTAEQLARCLREGVLAAVLHFEGAEAIDRDFDALEVFYQAGLRSLGLVWSRPNAFGYGVPFQYPRSPDTGPGLTEAGRDLVRACNRLGIMIDLSHLNEAGFWDVATLSDAPLVATHSGVHALCRSTRNLTDRQLDAIRETGGMVGLTFTVSDLREDGGNDADTPLSTMVRHIHYLTERVGIDGVGFGSDFDGTTVPTEIGDVTGLPRLVAALRESGYGDAELRKLTHENWLRVLRRTWGS